jgi:hypothetical protein
MRKLFAFLAILFLLFSAPLAQDGVDEVEEETDSEKDVIEDTFVEMAEDPSELLVEEEIILPSPDVVPSCVFPRFVGGRLPIGKVLELLLGFKNIGHKTFNITAIHGSFRYPSDPSIFVQNFTSWKYGAIVRPLEHVTLQYYFFPDELLEPKDYVFVCNVYYSDEENVNYTTTFFNSTIYMVEDSTPLDLKTFFTYFLILGVVGLVSYVIYTVRSGKKLIPASLSKATSVEKGTRASTSDSDEWLADSNFTGWKKQTKKAEKEKKNRK